jgi:hypothetical protein
VRSDGNGGGSSGGGRFDLERDCLILVSRTWESFSWKDTLYAFIKIEIGTGVRN